MRRDHVSHRLGRAGDRAIATSVPDIRVGAAPSVTVRRPSRAGARRRFLVAPGFDPAVVDFALEHDVPIVPGVCTPTEVGMALARGCRCSSCSPPRRRAAWPTSRHWPHRSVVCASCTGGIGPDNLASYLAVKQVIAAAGAGLVKKTLSRPRVDTIRTLAAQAREIACAGAIVQGGGRPWTRSNLATRPVPLDSGPR